MTDPRIHVLVEGLIDESEELRSLADGYSDERLALRALMNIRPPAPISADWLVLQDEVLSEENAARTVRLPKTQRVVLWQGDITHLAVDGIVNAANSGMLGCFGPLHYCVDNAIHSAAGLQLRAECNEIMQGGSLATGDVRVTSAWNLPAHHVIHAVGPIVSRRLTSEHDELLARAYRNVLNAARDHEMTSVALCCISTGTFGFPVLKAAQIAVREVRDFTERNDSVEQIVFCVYNDSDRRIYEELLS